MTQVAALGKSVPHFSGTDVESSKAKLQGCTVPYGWRRGRRA